MSVVVSVFSYVTYSMYLCVCVSVRKCANCVCERLVLRLCFFFKEEVYLYDIFQAKRGLKTKLMKVQLPKIARKVEYSEVSQEPTVGVIFIRTVAGSIIIYGIIISHG